MRYAAVVFSLLFLCTLALFFLSGCASTPEKVQHCKLVFLNHHMDDLQYVQDEMERVCE